MFGSINETVFHKHGQIFVFFYLLAHLFGKFIFFRLPLASFSRANLKRQTINAIPYFFLIFFPFLLRSRSQKRFADLTLVNDDRLN